MNELLYLQTQLNLILQSLGNWSILPMRLLSFLGQAEFFILVVPALYWCVDTGSGLRVGAMLLLSGAINPCLKWAFHQPRPYWVNPAVKALSVETSFGFPSNHAQTAAATWGVLATRVPWRKAWLVAAALAFLIGLSRLFLGVHFLTDVLAGWFIGGILLWCYLACERKATAWLEQRSLAQQIGVALAGSLLVLAVGFGIQGLLRNYSLPSAWVENARLAAPGAALDPMNPKELITAAGFILGMGAGAAWLHHAGGMHTSGKDWHILLRYILGVAGVIVIWFGLRIIAPDTQDWAGYAFRYFYNMLTGLWITAIAPFIFLRMGLAAKAR